MRITKTPDPMVGQGRVEGREEFGKQAVEEYSLNKASFKRFPLRHYRQLEFAFDGVGELLGKASDSHPHNWACLWRLYWAVRQCATRDGYDGYLH